MERRKTAVGAVRDVTLRPRNWISRCHDFAVAAALCQSAPLHIQGGGKYVALIAPASIQIRAAETPSRGDVRCGLVRTSTRPTSSPPLAHRVLRRPTVRKVDSNAERILARIRQLGPGEHLCTIQRRKEEQLAPAAAFIRGGLERGESLYVAHPDPGPILRALQSQGVEVDSARKSGILTVIDKRPYLRHGRFYPDEMFRFLSQLSEAARARFSG